MISRGLFWRRIAMRVFVGPIKKQSGTRDASDVPHGGLTALSFFFPVVGLILFIAYRDQFPLKAKSCGKAALIGTVFDVIIIITSFIALSILFI
jgi:hypothetical protein